MIFVRDVNLTTCIVSVIHREISTRDPKAGIATTGISSFFLFWASFFATPISLLNAVHAFDVTFLRMTYYTLLHTCIYPKGL